jgi:hypothetical protein
MWAVVCWCVGADYRVVAKGLRNPFRLAVDKWGGVAIANVGWNARDVSRIDI